MTKRTTTVLLVHGAWSNASAWSKVLPLLDEAGVSAIAAQLPLASLPDDVATLKRAIACVAGPVLLVGHSYGGAVITEAGSVPDVTGLVYVAAFAPDAGESAGGLGAGAPPTRILDVALPDAEGFLKLTREGAADVFAHDLAAAEQFLVYATQGPLAVAALMGPVAEAAWRSKPSWYLRATEDRVIHPDLQDTMSRRMGADTTNVASSHVPMLSQPRVVADLIFKALR
jgi:pimeloyl-ACP methyl ester carboxylesterase